MKVFFLRYRAYFLACGFALLFFALQSLNWFDFQEPSALDLLFKLRGEKKASSDIVIVQIDDTSIAALGEWPWGRSVHAALLEALTAYKPRAIFYDVLFTESSPDPKEDQVLAFALKQAGNVILPFYYYSENPFGAFFPIQPLREAAAQIGYINTDPDRDGQFRKIRLSLTAGGKTYYHTSVLEAHDEKDHLSIQDWIQFIPHDRQNRFLINYPGSMKSFQTLSFVNVVEALDTEKEPEMEKLFENRVVLIGHTGTGSTDLKPTPFSHLEPGVVIQASAVNTLLTRQFLYPLHWALKISILLLLSIWTAWMTQNLKPIRGVLFFSGTVIIYSLLIFILFLFGILMPLFIVWILMLLNYVLLLFLKYMETLLQGELVKRELTTASRIQEAFLPVSHPESASLDIAFECHFAKQVGGDLYDWIDFGHGKFGICIGDVSGKGVPAALYMAKALSDFRRARAVDLNPDQICDAFNQALVATGASGMFLTFIYVQADLSQKKIFFSNAGHEPLLFYSHQKQKAEIIQSGKAMPLGMFDIAVYEASSLDFTEGDVFLLFSDGVRELRNPHGEEFGVERIRQALEAQARTGKSSQAIISGIFEVMKSHRKHILPHDDSTFVCVRFP